MKLTESNKAHIDKLTYEELLRSWRFSPSGDPWFQGETGKYWGERMEEIKGPDHVAISKSIGWKQ